MRALDRLLRVSVVRSFPRNIAHFAAVMGCLTCVFSAVLYVVYVEYSALEPAARPFIATTLWVVFFTLQLLGGVGAWLLVRAHDILR